MSDTSWRITLHNLWREGEIVRGNEILVCIRIGLLIYRYSTDACMMYVVISSTLNSFCKPKRKLPLSILAASTCLRHLRPCDLTASCIGSARAEPDTPNTEVAAKSFRTTLATSFHITRRIASAGIRFLYLQRKMEYHI